MFLKFLNKNADTSTKKRAFLFKKICVHQVELVEAVKNNNNNNNNNN